MKTISKIIIVMVPLFFIIGTIGALDTTSYQFLYRLVNLRESGAPEVFEDGVLFTCPSSYKRVGIAFGHEGFSKVYWFQKLMIPDDAPKPQTEENSKKIIPPTYKEAGILFFVYTVPRSLESLEYRLIINGLWTTDPLNPQKRVDESGVARSVAPLPQFSAPLTPQESPTGYVVFRYQAPPHETVSVAGSFNNWDPFMYELKEESPGNYALAIQLPPGTYQYAFFHRGERFPDPNNREKAYRDRRLVSQLSVP